MQKCLISEFGWVKYSYKLSSVMISSAAGVGKSNEYSEGGSSLLIDWSSVISRI